MKKILFLLLSTIAMYGQVPADATPLENIQITNNKTSTTATKVNVQEANGTINTISKSDLVNVVEVNDVPSLPLVGEVGKIYVVKNVNKIYRWNGTFYQELAGSDISGLQAQINLKANDSDVVKLTGNQSITGQKSFSLTGKIDMQTNNASPAIIATTLGSNGASAAMFINSSSSPYSSALNLQTGLSGGVGNKALYVSNQSSIGTGIYSDASNGGVSISSQSGNGDSYISNITDGGTGRNYVGRNNGIETYSVDKIGNVLGNSYIKRSTPANNILLAGGGDLAQGTAFNKNFGTTAGTVVEGGTLGSNAYSSTVIPTNTNQLTNGAGYITDISGKVDKVTGKSLIADSEITRLATVTNQDISGKENAFTKNTAFNKNFGTTAGTVVEGNDSRINNGQTAYSWGNHAGLYPSLTGTGANGTWGINISGSASSATNWGGISANFVNWEDTPQYLLGVSAGVAHYYNQQYVRNFLGLGSNAYTSTAYLPLSGGTLTGIVTAPTAPAGTNTTQIATTAFVQENSRPYKVYTALLSQSGTNAPVATVLENTLGGTVVWSYVSIGQYRGTLTGAFLSNKTVVFLTNVYGKYFLTGGRENDNSVMIGTQAQNGGSTNGDLSNSSIEIRVYN